ncbi:hypothetical protein [Niveibacterium sp. 24ML]|uniref:hypothetical protein n=1 Tax=Niveibacterium sp. 24ML TaxID=2985512 RepID=UPI003B633A97
MTTPSKTAPAKPLTPQQQIKTLQEQLREANEKAQRFEAIVEVLKDDDGVRVVKSLPASPHSNAPERGKGLPVLQGYQPPGALSG